MSYYQKAKSPEEVVKGKIKFYEKYLKETEEQTVYAIKEDMYTNISFIELNISKAKDLRSTLYVLKELLEDFEFNKRLKEYNEKEK